MDPITLGLLGLGAEAGGMGVTFPELLRTTPAPNSAGQAQPALQKAYEEIAAKRGIPASAGRPVYRPYERKPGSFTQADMMQSGGHAISQDLTSKQIAELRAQGAGDLIDDDGRLKETVMYNPNSDRAILAHEMGHSMGSKTKIGGAARRAQQHLKANPNLAKAIGFSALISAGVAPAMIPGDDDALISAGIMAVASAPQLIDEFNATREGLGILKGADMRASLGQRGRLAGAYLTYAGMPVINGAIMAAIGNNFDENI